MMTKTFTIYETNFNNVSNALFRLATKAGRYGTHLAFSFDSETHPEKVAVYNSTGRHDSSLDFWADARTVTISYELVKISGWQPVAKVERIPLTDRRVVTTFGDDIPVDRAWYANDMHCDHCHTAHRRDTVYILRRDDGNMTQVGRSCLKDYTGIDPTALITWAEIRDICLRGDEPYVDPDDEDFWKNDKVYFDVDLALALASDIVARYGYVKSSEPDSTKSRLYYALASRKSPTQNGNGNAVLIRDWLLNSSPKTEYEENCRTMAEAGLVSPSHLGYLAYMPLAYERALEREASRRKAAAESTSQYVGEVGDRIQITVASAKIVSSWTTDFGMAFLWTIKDPEGNVFVWRTNKDGEALRGMTTIKGTVKGHDEYNGIRQTSITRCCVS